MLGFLHEGPALQSPRRRWPATQPAERSRSERAGRHVHLQPLSAQGIGSIAVMPNDPVDYPEDSFDNMKRIATGKRFPLPYVIDESQDVARIDELAAAMAQIAANGTGPKEQRPSVGCTVKWKK